MDWIQIVTFGFKNQIEIWSLHVELIFLISFTNLKRQPYIPLTKIIVRLEILNKWSLKVDIYSKVILDSDSPSNSLQLSNDTFGIVLVLWEKIKLSRDKLSQNSLQKLKGQKVFITLYFYFSNTLKLPS